MAGVVQRQGAALVLLPRFGEGGQRIIDEGGAHLLSLALMLVSAVGLVAALLAFVRNIAAPNEKLTGRRVLLFDVEGGASGRYDRKTVPTDIIEAASNGDCARLRNWLQRENCSVDSRTIDGTTALHAAATNGHVGAIRLLLDGNADVLAADVQNRTALHYVADEGHGTCVKALLDAGADPEGQDCVGATPMSLAQQGRHVGCLRLMQMHMERCRVGDLNKAAVNGVLSRRVLP